MADNKSEGKANFLSEPLKELVKSGQFCQNIIAHAGEGIIVYDTNFNYVVWNKFMEELTGLPAKKVIGQNAFKLFPHLRAQKVDILLKQALKDQKVYSPDTPFKVPGTNRSGWVRGLYSPYYDEKGKIIGIIGLVRDITERKKSELALKKSEEKFSKVFSASPEIITISTVKEGKIIEANGSFLKATGYKLEEVIGRTGEELKIFKNYKDREKIVKMLTEKGKYREVLFHMQNRFGEPKEYLLSGEIIEIGAEKYLLTLAVDITEMKKAEETRLESRRQYQIILDNIPEMVIIHQAGKIVYVNPEITRVGGYKPEEIVGTPLEKYVVKKFWVKVVESIKRRLAGEEVDDYDIEVKVKSGKTVGVQVRAVPVVYNGKRSFLTVLTDVSERQRSEASIKEYAGNLQKNVVELERFKKLTIGRELKMVELKKEIAWLKGKRV